MSNFPFFDVGGPQTAGKRYGPGKFGTQCDWFMNRAGAATVVGGGYVSDVSNSDGSATSSQPTTTGILAQLIDPTANFIIGKDPGFVVVAQDAVDDNAECFGCWHGYTEALVIDASNSPGVGAQLTLDTSNRFDAIVASTERRFAFLLEALTDPTSAVLADIMFEYEGMAAPGTGSFGAGIS